MWSKFSSDDDEFGTNKELLILPLKIIDTVKNLELYLLQYRLEDHTRNTWNMQELYLLKQ